MNPNVENRKIRILIVYTSRRVYSFECGTYVENYYNHLISKHADNFNRHTINRLTDYKVNYCFGCGAFTVIAIYFQN